jgi:hypothetical protein
MEKLAPDHPMRMRARRTVTVYLTAIPPVVHEATSLQVSIQGAAFECGQ